jgi:hypothetical protein
MHFDDSLFQCEAEGTGDEARDKRRKKDANGDYVAKTCNPEWFKEADLVDSKEEAHVILKYSADLCYHRQQFSEATRLYHQVVDVRMLSNFLPSFHLFLLLFWLSASKFTSAPSLDVHNFCSFSPKNHCSNLLYHAFPTVIYWQATFFNPPEPSLPFFLTILRPSLQPTEWFREK